MTRAVFQFNQKQFFVKTGDQILVDYIKSEKENSTILISTIIMILTNTEIVLGKPFIKDYKISATVLKCCVKDKKIFVFKKKRRKGFHKTIGHRQKYTKIIIKQISRI